MIVTKSWLNEWIDLHDISTEHLLRTLNSIGLEVDSVRNYAIPSKIVFGHVLECERHPDADKLSVCKVDIGTSVRQIVCGAANVRTGLNVVVATVGAVMPSGLVIKPIKLRGVDSEGMICSASEIGLESFAEGILELDESLGKFELGQEVSMNPIFGDDIIEIELTANRGDCLSIRGVARDLSAALNRPMREQQPFEDEDRKVGIGRILSLTHDKDLEINLRFKAIDLQELKIPFVVRLRLAQIGETRETDIESLMLYATHSSGVILRAYEYDYFCQEGEQIARVELKDDENGYTTLYGTKKASTIGIIQEDEAKVKVNEGTILLEASYIEPETIAKKMHEKKIKSGPMYYRTSRGSEPELNIGLDFVLNLITANSRSSVYGGTVEYCDNYENTIVTISKEEIDSFIGMSIDKAKITKIFKNLGFETSKSQANNFVVSIPRYRHDIVNKQDLVEEIVRLVGIDNIQSKPFTFTEANRTTDDFDLYKKRRTYRHKAAQSGFFESVHFVFDDKKFLQEQGFATTKEELELLNPIVNTLDTLRPTLMCALLKAASMNAKNGYKQVKLFEVGSVFSPEREESLKMALLFSGDESQQSIRNAGRPKKVDFGFFVQKIADVIGRFDLIEAVPTHKLAHLYQYAHIVIDGEVVGELFKLDPTLQESLDLDETFVCEIEFSKLPYGLKVAKESSKFQASLRDLSLLIPKNMSFGRIRTLIEESVQAEELVSFYPVDIYEDDSLGENKSLSIRFVLQSSQKTLQEEEITQIMESILSALKENLGVGLR